MSLNNIQLHPKMLADLYPDVLVESKTGVVPQFPPVQYLGENQKNILIIVSNNTETFLPDHDLAFLTSILSACRLGMTDIALVNIYGKSKAEIQHTLQQTGAVQVILFGVEPVLISLPENYSHFQMHQHHQRTYLSSPGLFEVSQEKALKTKLWGCHKSLFGI